MPEFFFDNKLFYNPVEFVMDRIGGTWKMPILWRLRNSTMRYGELKKPMPIVNLRFYPLKRSFRYFARLIATTQERMTTKPPT